MDNEKPQISFDLLNPATIIFTNGSAVNTNTYRLSDKGIQFVSDTEIPGTGSNAAKEKRYYFYPWHMISCFYTTAKDTDPIATPSKQPQG